MFVTMYGLTLLAIRIFGLAMSAYATRERLFSADDDPTVAAGHKGPAVLIAYVITILIGLALPVLAVAIYFGLAVFLVVPFGVVRRSLSRRRNGPSG